uniref:Vacuolar protein sorting-associated protein 13 n=1 Tax=Cuerna arida TaxID=1464854 RepID=A0A1B6F8B5_9HEMI
MVFESIVTDLLNKYLGEYVENLDTSQLNIGIWGGKVELRNLQLKQSALDDLQLPVQIVSGYLGNLFLKIPWTNLYNSSVEAVIEDLNLLVVPNSQVKYDKAKEEKWKQEMKQAAVNKVEEAKRQEKEKFKQKIDDTFAEKLATQIIRNVQITIKNIHIRYEDRKSNKGKPFTFGLTLSSLVVTTTDKKWNPELPTEITAMIYKILMIDNLSIYWNSNTQETFIGLPDDQLLEAFQDAIDGKKNYTYMLGPIVSQSYLQINTKPENDEFKIPKVELSLELQELTLRITKSQYQDMMGLLESCDYMIRATPFRKYRPSVESYRGHYDKWWKFAYECILHEEVRRRQRNWDWMHIHTHRKACKEYAQAYEKKLVTSKPSAELIKSVQTCEKHLDALNIVLVRQKIEVEVERKGLLKKALQKEAGWFSGWWGGSSKQDGASKSDIRKQFQEAMTPAEKQKLYRAIGYQENAAPTQYPVEFVAVDVKFSLAMLEVEIRNESSQVLDAVILGVTSRFEQRPAGQAFKLTANLKQFLIRGLKQGDIVPELLQGKVGEVIAPTSSSPSEHLLNILVEMKPLSGECDQLVHILSQPLQLVYDAQTINKLLDVFTVETNTVITQLNAAAYTKLVEMKEKSALGFQHALQQRLKMDLNIDLMGCYGILPHGGLYTGVNQSLVGVNLGRMQINCNPRPPDEVDIQTMVKRGSTETDILKEMMNRCYDRFVVELKEAQIQMMMPGEVWKSIPEGGSEQYILEPTNLTVVLEKCLITDDPRLPKIKVSASLPNINIRVGEKRLFSTIALFISIPFNESKYEDALPTIELHSSQQSLNITEITRATSQISDKKPTPRTPEDEMVQFIELEVKFELKEISVAVFRKIDEGTEQPLADFRILALEAELIQQTYDLNVSLRLGGLSLFQDYEGEKIRIINTPMAEGKSEYLLVVNLCKVDRASPEFHSKHGSVLNSPDTNFSKVDFLVHQEAFLDAMQWASRVQEFFASMTAKEEEPKVTTSRLLVPNRSSRQITSGVNVLFEDILDDSGWKQKRRRRQVKVNTIDLKLIAVMGEVSLTLKNSQRMVGAMHVKGGQLNVIVKRTYTQIDGTLNNFVFYDLREDTYHPKVFYIEENVQAVVAQVIIFQRVSGEEFDPIEDKDKVDMTVTARIACFRVVFLNYVVMSLLEFLNKFSAAQAAIIEASTAAAVAAKANVQLAYEAAFRMLLNIELKAPILVIPANSRSFDAVVLDFGDLKVKNHLSDHIVTVENEDVTVLVDNLNLALENLTMTRVKFGEKMNIVSECPLLEPVSFQLDVRRNLTSQWRTDFPDLDVSGRLNSIHIKLTQYDYTMILSIITQNLSEVPPTIDIVPSTLEPAYGTPTATNLSEGKRSPRTRAKMMKAKEDRKVVKQDETGPIRVIVQLNFTMDSLIVDLFKNDDSQDKSMSCLTACPSNGLARFTLQVLSVKTRMMSDNSLTVSALLLDCLLDDTRPSQEGKICRYMERKPDYVSAQQNRSSGSNTRWMLDITFQQSPTTMFVDVRVYSFILILNIEHLMSISDFFMSGLQQQTTAPVTKSKTIRGVSSQTPVTSKDIAPVAETPSHTVPISISLLVEQPDIILVENLDDINTNAIIMNNEINLKIRMEDGEEAYTGSINDFQLFSCCFNPEKRKETKSKIIRPVTVFLVGCKGETQGFKLDFTTTNICVAVTPGTLELLTKIMQIVTAGKQSIVPVEEEEHDYSDIWGIDHFDDVDYWFLKTELAEDAWQVLDLHLPRLNINEICVLKIPSMWITLEAGVGNKTLPMLLIEYNMHACVKSWSSQVNAEASMNLQVSYYNSRLALWEPLVEPVEVIEPKGVITHVPWELTIQVETNDSQKQEENEIDGIGESSTRPKCTIAISSKETMELTVTKTCLDVMKNLGTAFNNAIFKPEMRSSAYSSPYVVQNDLGVNIKVSLNNGIFKLFDQEGLQNEVEEVVLESGANVSLCLVEHEDTKSLDLSLAHVREKYLQISVPEPPSDLDLPVARADKRYFSLQHRSSGNDTWGIVSDVQVIEGCTVITLRGILQVHNHFNTPVSVYFMTKKGNEVQLVGSVQPHQHLNLPLDAIYTPTNELFFTIEGYSVSIAPFIWKDLQNSLVISKILQCNHKNPEDLEPFFIQAVGELEQVYFEHSNRHTMSSSCYNIHLRPTVTLKNFLPVDIEVCTQGIIKESHVPSGEMLQIPTAEPGTTTIGIRIKSYLDRDWSSQQLIAANPPELSVWTFHSYESKCRIAMDLGVHCVNEYGTLKLALYCPFWMLNKTSLMLSYRHEDVNNVLYHPPSYQGPIMFSFRAKSFFGKKKAAIMVDRGEWSDKFSLDAAGSSGVVICKSNDTTYQIGVHIQLMYNSLTKQVTFTPYHILVNQCKVAVEIQETNRLAEPWIRVEPMDVCPFWPKTIPSEKSTPELVMRLADTVEETSPFPFNCTFNYMLKLENKYGGVEVYIQKTEGAVYITFNLYHPGMAPALILNHSNHEIVLQEKATKSVISLLPRQKKLFTWTSPKDKHVLTWCENYSTELKKDEVGHFNVSPSVRLYWSSFLDGMQRVLLFTADADIAREVEASALLEVMDLEVNLSIHGVGLSLVDNEMRKELIYLGISSSGAVWEFAKPGSKKFKKIKPKDSALLETLHTRYKQELNTEGKTTLYPARCTIRNNFEVNFETNEILKPDHRVMRRTFNEGLWIVYRVSPHQMQLHAKVNRLQIDNQMYDCEFPVIFAPVPPPKSVNMENAMKPFVELSLLRRLNKHSSLMQFKYLQVLIQEFEVKVDIGFINALAKMFEAGTTSDSEEAELFARDRLAVSEPLSSHVTQLFSQDKKNHFDILHFSPLKIHLSFSLSGEGGGVPAQLPPVLNILLQTFGVTVANVQDVILKLSYFERNYTFLSEKQLMTEVQMHYLGQLLKQFYVLALGLDVMGNPYGLVIGITEGVSDLFYEPMQGIVQGPGEFAEGLVLGVRSLFGHTVGGAAGAVSRITGAMGKGIAALTLDEDYQRKRREALNYRPATVQEGLAHSGKGLFMGVVEGVGGVFTKPISGARQEGVGGFVKGVGKGMVGLVTRPTAGVIDFASGSFSAVKRYAELGEETTRLRHPRFFNPDNLVRPYCRRDAEGNRLLKELEKGKYYMTDIYVCHIPLANSKKILLLTDKRLLVLSHNEIFGGNQVDLSHVWGELTEPPKIVSDGIQIKLEGGKKKLGLFRSNDVKLLPISDEDQKRFIAEQIQSLMSAISPLNSVRRGSRPSSSHSTSS